MRALLTALLLTACSGSLVDHLGVSLQTPPNPDGGDGGTCAENVLACGASCTPCAHRDGQVASCDQGQCSYAAAPAACTAPSLACAGGCCLPTQVAAGGDTTCAILGDSVRCWGTQLGSASESSGFPVEVQGLKSPSRIAVGPAHACAIVASEVQCWGANESGQLGQAASTNPSPTPLAAVANVPDPIDIVVGDRHSCALTRSSGVFCWGADDVGQLGSGAGPARSTAVAVAGTSGASSISGGLLDTCVTIGNGVSCWGANDRGQIGTSKPGAVFPITPVTFKGGNITPSALASGEAHNCAIVNSTIQCWGAGTAGQIGDGSTVDQTLPQSVAFFAPVFVVGGGSHTCATSTGGQPPAGDDDPAIAAGLYCWGANDSGQLGTGTIVSVHLPPVTPILFTPANAVIQLAAGTAHSCALLQGNFLSCWGKNDKGQIGTGTTTVLVPSPTQVTTVAQ